MFCSFFIFCAIFLGFLQNSNSACNKRKVQYTLPSEVESPSDRLGKKTLFPLGNIFLGNECLHKFVERGLVIAKTLIDKVVIPPISFEVPIVVTTIIGTIKDLGIENFEIKSFDIFKANVEGSMAATFSDATLSVTAEMDWYSKGWPNIEGHYFIEFYLKDMSLLAVGNLGESKECAYHIGFEITEQSFTIGRVFVNITENDGSSSIIGAIINLLLDPLAKLLEKELQPILIGVIVQAAMQAIDGTMLVYGSNSNFSAKDAYLAIDFRYSNLRIIEKGISIDFGNYLLATNMMEYSLSEDAVTPMRDNEMGLSLKDRPGVVILPEYYYDPSLDLEFSPGKKTLFEKIPSGTDLKYTFNIHSLNSLFHISTFYKMSFFEGKLNMKSDFIPKNTYPEPWKLLFSKESGSVLESYLKANGMDDVLDTWSSKDIVYTFEKDPSFTPYIEKSGAAGLLMPNEYYVKVSVGQTEIIKKKIRADFVLKPRIKMYGQNIIGDFSLNKTAINFDFLPYGYLEIDENTNSSYLEDELHDNYSFINHNIAFDFTQKKNVNGYPNSSDYGYNTSKNYVFNIAPDAFKFVYSSKNKNKMINLYAGDGIALQSDNVIIVLKNSTAYKTYCDAATRNECYETKLNENLIVVVLYKRNLEGKFNSFAIFKGTDAKGSLEKLILTGALQYLLCESLSQKTRARQGSNNFGLYLPLLPMFDYNNDEYFFSYSGNTFSWNINYL